jgi:hypothetical protein
MFIKFKTIPVKDKTREKQPAAIDILAGVNMEAKKPVKAPTSKILILDM